MRLYGMPDGRAARPRHRDCTRTLMGRWTSTSGQRHQPARSRTGFPRAPTEGSRFSSASTAPRNHCSTRPVRKEQLLAEAARAGAAMARANTFASRDPRAQVYPDRRWEWAFGGGSASWDAQGYVNVDNRAAWNYAATGNSPAMVQRTAGSGSQYLMATRDASGAFFDGGRNYRFHLLLNVPVKLFVGGRL